MVLLRGLEMEKRPSTMPLNSAEAREALGSVFVGVESSKIWLYLFYK